MPAKTLRMATGKWHLAPGGHPLRGLDILDRLDIVDEQKTIDWIYAQQACVQTCIDVQDTCIDMHRHRTRIAWTSSTRKKMIDRT